MKLTLVAVGAFAAFVVAGPLQHVGVLPQNVLSDASKSTIKAVLNVTVSEALACRGGFGGRGKGNNGFGNGGGDGVPGNSNKQDRTR